MVEEEITDNLAEAYSSIMDGLVFNARRCIFVPEEDWNAFVRSVADGLNYAIKEGYLRTLYGMDTLLEEFCRDLLSRFRTKILIYNYGPIFYIIRNEKEFAEVVSDELAKISRDEKSNFPYLYRFLY